MRSLAREALRLGTIGSIDNSCAIGRLLLDVPLDSPLPHEATEGRLVRALAGGVEARRRSGKPSSGSSCSMATQQDTTERRTQK
jgi:hypothetical protein